MTATLLNASFANADLSRARFQAAQLTNADFQDADISAAGFPATTQFGFTREQLYATSSYIRRDLSRIDFSFNDLRQWTFRVKSLSLRAFRSLSWPEHDLMTHGLMEQIYLGRRKQGLHLTSCIRRRPIETAICETPV